MRRIVALAAVSLVLGFAGVAGADGNGVSVGISNEAYSPIVATIRPGGTVTWVNNDAETHSVFIDAVGADHLVAPGATYAYTFGDAGEFTYHCTLHSHAGKVVVAVPVATTAPPPPPPPPATTVATTLAPTTVPTVATTIAPEATAAATTAAPVTTEPTTTVTEPGTVAETDSTLEPLAGVRVDGGGGGGLPSAALIGGGGAGAALGVGAGFVIKRRVSRRAAASA